MSSPADELLEALLRVDLSALDMPALQRHAVSVQTLLGRVTGHLHDALRELHGGSEGMVPVEPTGEMSPPDRLLRHWWREAVTLTGQQSGAQVRHAVVLGDLPVISAAVRGGELGPVHAKVLSRLHGRIPLADLQESEPQLVEVARGMDTDALGKWVSHLIATHCEPALEADQARAHERRYLQLRTDADGTVHGRFLLASEDAEAMLTVLEPLARRNELTDVRSAGRRRADALVEVFAAASAWMDLPQAGGQRAHVSYVVPAGWAAGDAVPSMAEHLAAAGAHALASSQLAASAAWTGPRTRARVEAVLCDARISRVLLDTSGQVQSLQSTNEQITPAQRRAVSARDRQCVAKGCTRPPAFCDIHHVQSREHGGATCVENLVLLCRRHHVLWHRGNVGLHDLHVPWLPEAEELREHDPWSRHNAPLVA
jgi:hypothetical protein